MRNANGEVERLFEHIDDLNNEFVEAQTKARFDAEAARKEGIKSGKSEAIDEVTELLDADLNGKTAERLSSLCEKAKDRETKQLNIRIRRLQKRIENRPSDKTEKALSTAEKKLSETDTKTACFIRRQRIRRKCSQRRWHIAIIVLFSFCLSVLLYGINAKQEASGYRKTLIDIADGGLNGNGSLTREVWNEILAVYNDEYGSDYTVGR